MDSKCVGERFFKKKKSVALNYLDIYVDNQKIQHIYRNKIRKDEKRQMIIELLMTIFYMAIGLGIVFIGIGTVAMGILFITGSLK